MLTTPHIELALTGPIARITLTRPESLNALSSPLLNDLDAALDRIDAAGDVRAVILTATGRAFCAGADLSEVLELLGQGAPDFLDLVARVFGRIRALPVPVIGGINGITMAGGLELAMCCDILIAADSARIGDAHANFGLFPGAGGAAVLPGRIGLMNAKYLLFTGAALPAADWLRMGLLQEVVPDDALDARLDALARSIATKSPLSLSRMKAIANASAEEGPEALLRRELALLREHLASNDAQEGLRAFAEKRKPVFTGT